MFTTRYQSHPPRTRVGSLRPALVLVVSAMIGLGCRGDEPQVTPPPSAIEAPVVATAPSAPVNVAASVEAPLPTPTPVTIDVYADYVCPWCYIGTARLERAIVASGLADRVVVRRHPYLLDAEVPDEGVDLADRLQKKYNRDPKEMFARVEAVAKETGIPLDFTKQSRTYSTVAAHVLMHHAIAAGASETQQRGLEADLFKLHFVDGGRISDPAALVKLAETHGLDPAAARAALDDPKSAAEVRRLAREAQGIGGVPYFKFSDGKTISGAQSEAALAAAIKLAAEGGQAAD